MYISWWQEKLVANIRNYFAVDPRRHVVTERERLFGLYFCRWVRYSVEWEMSYRETFISYHEHRKCTKWQRYFGHFYIHERSSSAPWMSSTTFFFYNFFLLISPLLFHLPHSNLFFSLICVYSIARCVFLTRTGSSYSRDDAWLACTEWTKGKEKMKKKEHARALHRPGVFLSTEVRSYSLRIPAHEPTKASWLKRIAHVACTSSCSREFLFLHNLSLLHGK